MKQPGRLARARGAAVLGVALLAACASPPPAEPGGARALPVPDRFPAQAPPAAAPAMAAAADTPWQSFFTDERLKALIALALQNNRDLRIAAASIEAAQAQAALREADRWPTLNLGASASRTPTASGGIASLYSLGLQVSAWELDLFGRLRGLSDAAAAQVLASEQARRALQISLVAAVAQAWQALQADARGLALAEQALATRADSLRLIRLRVERGASSELDLRQAETLLESARVSLAQATRARALDENALALLLGQGGGPGAALAPPDATAAWTSVPDLPAGLPSEVLTRRPDVRQAELQLLASEANIAAARAAYFPRITLTGSAGLASGDLSRLFRAGTLAWSFAPQLLQPIFDAGRTAGNLKLAQANRELALAQYERAIQGAFREVADALAGRATLGEQLGAQQRLVDAERERARLSELRYRHGAASHLEWLDAQRSLFAAEQGLVQVQLLAAQNGVGLYKALGGGWN